MQTTILALADQADDATRRDLILETCRYLAAMPAEDLTVLKEVLSRHYRPAAIDDAPSQRPSPPRATIHLPPGP